MKVKVFKTIQTRLHVTLNHIALFMKALFFSEMQEISTEKHSTIQMRLRLFKHYFSKWFY